MTSKKSDALACDSQMYVLHMRRMGASVAEIAAISNLAIEQIAVIIFRAGLGRFRMSRRRKRNFIRHVERLAKNTEKPPRRSADR